MSLPRVSFSLVFFFATGCFEPGAADDGSGATAADPAGTDTTLGSPGTGSATAPSGTSGSSSSSTTPPDTDSTSDDPTSETQGDSTGSGTTTDDEAATSEGSTSTGPAAPTVVVMFSAAPVDGDILAAGGMASSRASADALCDAAISDYPGLACTEVHALLSVNENDEIRDMPANYDVPLDLPVEGPTGVPIDDGFMELLDGSIANSPLDAEVVTTNASIWTGSNSAGVVLNTTCSGWTATDGAGPNGAGSAGDADNTGAWLGAVSALCNAELPFICLCW